jgi:hypothetical protein
MRYIGSKTAALPWLTRVIAERAPDAAALRDPFAGTCTVARHFKAAGMRVVTGDELALSYVSHPDCRAIAMDNLGSHKVPGVREAIEAAGASVMYLPAYSPDLNPIEMVIAKIKSILRKMAIRTVEELWEALGSITDCVTATECRNFLRHEGYFQSG